LKGCGAWQEKLVEKMRRSNPNSGSQIERCYPSLLLSDEIHYSSGSGSHGRFLGDFLWRLLLADVEQDKDILGRVFHDHLWFVYVGGLRAQSVESPAGFFAR